MAGDAVPLRAMATYFVEIKKALCVADEENVVYRDEVIKLDD